MKFKQTPVSAILVRLACLVCLPGFLPGWPSVNAQENQTDQSSHWWKSEVESRLTSADENETELRQALTTVRQSHRRALEFLIEHMPEDDLRNLKPDFLLQNIELAYQALDRVPWGKQIPEEIFFNDILPYANVDETRESWRSEMMERCLPLIADCKTPGEAALKLNRELFPLIDVRYSTKRKKANQSPAESMEQSVASCTGLSIILTDACRSVGVPSRLAGIPSWTNKRGNHTWVEVWDDGWHFTGAAEPADKLNSTWFQNDASLADDSKPMNRVYAVSFARTGMYFPLVWSPDSRQANAVNVTDRYTRDKTGAPDNTTRVLVSVLSSEGTRLKREVSITDSDGNLIASGTTRDESADMNDILMFRLPMGTDFKVTWNEPDDTAAVAGESTVEFSRSSGAGEQISWRFRLSESREYFLRRTNLRSRRGLSRNCNTPDSNQLKLVRRLSFRSLIDNLRKIYAAHT